MTAGRGFIAIAAVIFGGWTLRGTISGCFLFGVADALRLALPALGHNLNPQLLISAPYLLALIAMCFFAQRARYADALAAGKVLPPAKSLDDMHTVVTNSTVDGILAAFFGLLVVIILLDAVRVWIRALRSRTPLPTTEEPRVESLISAPEGLLGGAGEDRREIAAAGRRGH